MSLNRMFSLLTLGMASVMSVLGCETPPFVAPATVCTDAPHFQIVSAEITLYKSGYAGMEKNQDYPSGHVRVVSMNTCTGQAVYLHLLDEKGATFLKSQWIPVTGT